MADTTDKTSETTAAGSTATVKEPFYDIAKWATKAPEGEKLISTAYGDKVTEDLRYVKNEPGVHKPDPILVADNVTRRFGGMTAVDVRHFEIERHGITALIGPNGAGKTTLLNLISGIYDVDGGNIFFNGKDVTKLPTHVRAKMGIGRTFQSPRFMNRASIEDNLKVGTDLLNQFGYIQSFFGKKGHDFMKNLEELMEIAGFTFDWQDQITSLPYGQQKLLEIVRAMLAQPKLILVDEPAAGLNKQEQERASQLLFHAVKKGVGVVLIEHSMDMVMSICDRITVLSFGKVIAEGLPVEIANNQQVIEAYLGGDDDA